MALRVKCKCGKSLKIPTKLAGRKLACPGCKKPFRIPAEKFRAATATAAKPAPRPVKKPAPVVEPAPVELDITPANLDLEWSGDIAHSRSDLLFDQNTGAAPAAMDATGATASPFCPSCHVALVPDAKVCVECGLDLKTGKSIVSEVAPAAVPVPKSAPAQLGYAGDPSKATGRRGVLGAAVEAPKRGFWADAFAGFLYPFSSGNNVATFVIILFVALLQILMQYGGIFGTIGSFIIFGWLAAVYLAVVQDTAAGSSDLPGIKMEDGFLEDIVKPALRYIGAVAVSLTPVIFYSILLATGVLPDALHSSAILTVWLIIGIFLMPIFIMLFAFNAMAMVFRIDLIFLTIIRTILPYLGLWLMLCLVGFLAVLPALGTFVIELNLDIPLPEMPDLGMIGEGISIALEVFLTIVSMRIIGLYYLHFKKRFAIVME